MAFFQIDQAVAACVIYSIPVSSPSYEPLSPLPAIPRGSLVIVEGRAPIWRYGMALHLLHGSPAAAVAFYDPRLGAVVVATQAKVKERRMNGANRRHQEAYPSR